MFRFSIRELFLITAVVALVVGWWVEHRGKTKAAEEAAYQEWKNRVLEVSLTGKGYTVKAEGKSVTVTGQGETTTITPTSLEHTPREPTRRRFFIRASYRMANRSQSIIFRLGPLPRGSHRWAAGEPVGASQTCWAKPIKGEKPAPMKYSLRSLMIGLTLFCVVLAGRIEYLRRWAVYHENEVARWRIVDEAGVNGDGAMLVTLWHHEELVIKYRHAMTRPWTVVKEPPLPQ